MDNVAAIATWRLWVRATHHYAGDVTPSEDANVDFWFVQDGAKANRHFHRFADTGTGSLIAVWSRDGERYDRGPVVLLGDEGDPRVLADDVAHALAMFAACGDTGLDEAVLYGATSAGPEEGMAAWLASTFQVPPPADVAAAARAAAERHPGLQAFTDAINGFAA